MILPAICTVTAAARDDLNRVFEAMGVGSGTFSVPLCAINPAATPETPATHYLMSHAGALDTEVAIWQAMTAGTLPPLPEGVAWGVDGVISAEDALAACDGAVFHVYSAAGDITPTDHAAAILASEGLQFVPEPPA